LDVNSPTGDHRRMPSTRPARIALVGDRSAAVRAHARIPRVLDTIALQGGPAVEAVWLPTDTVDAGAVAAFDGVWAVPGSPYASADGMLAAIRVAREERIPFLGTCGGFQYAMIEFARTVCGLEEVEHGESHPDAEALLIEQLECSLVGEERAIWVVPGTLAERTVRSRVSTERFHCAFGLNPAYRDVLEANGLRFSGFDEEGAPRIVELPGHAFFLATLFQPELAGDDGYAHPIVAAFAAAAANVPELSPA
jgi:CTP synthase (UTP-ammonia lyase)